MQKELKTVSMAVFGNTLVVKQPVGFDLGSRRNKAKHQ